MSVKTVYTVLIEGSEKGYDRKHPVLFDTQGAAASYIRQHFMRPSSAHGWYRVEMSKLSYHQAAKAEESIEGEGESA
jgi:hypothetical protein